MVTQKNISLEKARLFVSSLKKSGFDVAEAYLFGSVANGLDDKESDIDVAVVSSNFDGILYHDIGKISKHRRNIDLRLEIHPFSLREVEQDPSHFFQKIKREGLRIDV